ncbi:MAG TPA: OmpH family outer membrane protein [Bryobacteraceae bacterium]|nr:OmpH family outer membrane protein [Bryobacteraceae bacterium]
MSFRMFTPMMACSALLIAGQLAQAQSKIAVISLQKALFDTAEIKKAQNDMNAALGPRQQQAERLNQEINQINQKLNTDSTLTQQAQFDLQTQLKQKQTELTRLNEDLQADAQTMRQNILAKAGDRMQTVVKKLAEEKGLDLVVDTQVALYFKPVMDLTADATAAYDKTYPVAAAAPTAPPKK